MVIILLIKLSPSPRRISFFRSGCQKKLIDFFCQCYTKTLTAFPCILRTAAGVCLPGTVEKVGDVKCGAAAKDTLTAASEAAGFPWVVDQVTLMFYSCLRANVTLSHHCEIVYQCCFAYCGKALT